MGRTRRVLKRRVDGVRQHYYVLAHPKPRLVKPLVSAGILITRADKHTAWERFLQTARSHPKHRASILTKDFVNLVYDVPFDEPEPHEIRWHRAPIQEIPLEDTFVAQGRVSPKNIKRVLNHVEDTPPIRVLQYVDGTYWVYDGTHRIIAARLLGMNTIPAKVVEVDSEGRVVQ